MANVYISVLGTNDYLPCNYYANETRVVENVRFVQEATVLYRCSGWSSDDRILIFTTDEAYKKNWLDNGQTDRHGRVLERKGLKRCLDAIGTSATIQNVPIPEGRDQDEIWAIFMSIFSRLDRGDRVVFDITHSFRSIPMLVMIVVHYAKTLKKVTLGSIDYGALEALGSIEAVRAMDVKDRNVPIFDLTPFDRLLDWTLAIDRFLGTGDARAAAELARTEISLGSSGNVGEVAEKMLEFTMNIATCRGRSLSESAMALKQAVRDCEANDARPAFKDLMHVLQQGLDDFRGDEVSDGIASARWCLRHNLIQQGLTILQETLVSHLATSAGLDPHDRSVREIGPGSVVCVNKDEKDWTGKSAQCVEITRQYIETLRETPNLRKLFKKPWNKLKAYRNDVDHAGYTQNPKGAREFEAALQDAIEKAAALIKENSSDSP